MPSPLRLEMVGVSKSYAGVRALDGVDFSVAAGEVHCLLGENGAGKSTLMKILAGAVVADAGEIALDGAPVTIRDRRDALALGIGVIFQRPEIVDHLSVADNVTLGRERSHAGFVDRGDARARAVEVLNRLGAAIDPDRRAGALRAGERQLVEIARALSTDVRLLVMDEPTASLGQAEVEHLFRVIADLRAQGISVVYISHRLDEIFAVGDRITVLRDGTVVGTVAVTDTARDELIRMMVGRRALVAVAAPRNARPDVALEVRDLTTAGGVEGISFRLHAGEVLGVYGLLGSGRTELARALFGADRKIGGAVVLDGLPIRVRSPADAAACGFALVPEDRAAEGTMQRLSVGENLTLAQPGRFSRHGWLGPSEQRRRVRSIIRALGIKAASPQLPVASLSGGNQQKVVIGKWLHDDPRVFILDDPTAGVDVGAKAEIYRIITDLTARGTAVLLMSSELPELMALADRLLVLRGRRLAATLTGDELDEQRVLRLALGEAA